MLSIIIDDNTPDASRASVFYYCFFNPHTMNTLFAQNEQVGLDPDYWFEINLTNCQLFSNLSLDGIDELLSGRLFSTRMPRDLKTNPETGEKFRQKAIKNNLNTVLILTEKKEYAKYAGADLEEFYRSIGLEIISRPIPDFCVPNQPDMIDNIKVRC